MAGNDVTLRYGSQFPAGDASQADAMAPADPFAPPSLSSVYWEVRWSRNGIAMRYARQRGAVAHGRESGWLFGVLAVVAATIGIGTAGAMAGGAPAGGSGYAITVKLPPAALKVDASASSSHRPAPSKHVHTGPRTTGSADQRSAATPLAPSDAVQNTPVDRGAEYGDESSAIAAALAAGEMRRWTAADGARGYVVVGPKTGSGLCRDLSILVRHDGGANDVRQIRRCAAGSSTTD